jgi:hypothetical protein
MTKQLWLYGVVSITLLPVFLNECSIRSLGLPFTNRGFALEICVSVVSAQLLAELDSIFMPAYAPFSRVDNVVIIIRAIRFLLQRANRTNSQFAQMRRPV